MNDKHSNDLRELAAAMNRLADAINQTNALIADAKREDPQWQNLPSQIADLNRQLRMIASRL